MGGGTHGGDVRASLGRHQARWQAGTRGLGMTDSHRVVSPQREPDGVAICLEGPAGLSTRTSTSLQLEPNGHTYKVDRVFGRKFRTRLAANPVARLAVVTEITMPAVDAMQSMGTLIRATCTASSCKPACALRGCTER